MSVLVCEVDRISLIALPPEEQKLVLSMIGEVLKVYEIDAWERAWVEKVWELANDAYETHSIALDPAHMLRVAQNGA